VSLVDAHIKDHPLVLRTEPHKGPAAEYRLVVDGFVPPDYLDIGVRVGDAIHNVRSALDAAVWHLAILGSGQDPPPRVNRRKVQFPIFQKVADFESQGRDMIASLKDGPRAVIEGAQPCYRGDDSQLDALTLLARISNRDKHRVVVPMAVIPQSLEPNRDITVDKGVNLLEIIYTNATLENDATAIVLRFDRPTKVDMDVNITTPIVFDLSAIGYPQGFVSYGKVLDAIAQETNALLTGLSPFF